MSKLKRIRAIINSCRFVNTMPLKLCRVEDYITEADVLCSHWRIETPISIEDGRPFTYEVESLFHTRFSDQALESNMPPYEGLLGMDDDDSAGKAREFNDKWTEAMAGTAGYYDQASVKGWFEL